MNFMVIYLSDELNIKTTWRSITCDKCQTARNPTDVDINAEPIVNALIGSLWHARLKTMPIEDIVGAGGNRGEYEQTQ